MNLINFEGEEFTEDIHLEAGEFAVVCFKGERNKRIEMSAWEVDKERFDVLLVKPVDIMEDRFRDEQARIKK